MDFVVKIYTQILNLIKSILSIYGVDTSKIDELLAEVLPKEEEAPTESPIA